MSLSVNYYNLNNLSFGTSIKKLPEGTEILVKKINPGQIRYDILFPDEVAANSLPNMCLAKIWKVFNKPKSIVLQIDNSKVKQSRAFWEKYFEFFMKPHKETLPENLNPNDIVFCEKRINTSKNKYPDNFLGTVNEIGDNIFILENNGKFGASQPPNYWKERFKIFKIHASEENKIKLDFKDK